MVAPAPYFLGGQNNSGNGSSHLTGGPLSAYNGSLVAAYNFVNGSPSDQQTSLDFLFNGTNSGDLYLGSFNGSTAYNGYNLGTWAHGGGNAAADYFGITGIVAGYDAQRTGGGIPILGILCYEGGFMGGPVVASDATTIANDLTNFGDTNGYTSGLPGAVAGPGSTPTSDGNNLLTLLTAFKNDNRFKLLSLAYFNSFISAATSQGNRLAIPAWYTLHGGTNNSPDDFSLYPG